ncbi:hypothetical protein [Phycicoccus flavus]|uniref:hypothetical protein n=1 Tax=Phycicoccus flavus TaxID=2502783 RepID=UPI000FEB9D95|nr:hypothetical protein [Phycicoccus flavus]NHA69979.1 hypothetical protein [Phycicoccus flavus]
MTPPRSPRFLRIIVTGAVLGFLAGAVLATGGWLQDESSVLTQQGQYSANTSIGYLGLLGAGLMALLAAVVALGIDWWQRRS